MSKFTIIQDTREKPEYKWQFPECDECLGTKAHKLDTGDYSIEGLEHLVAIERKRCTGEIAQNMCEDRFKDVIARLSTFKYRYIICEFNYQDILNFPIGSNIPKKYQHKIRISANWMESYVLSLVSRHGIPVLFAGDADNGKRMAFSILKKIASYELNDV